ncbi:MAG: tRNA (adenosine(37)-N6)-dimethylallyltransferase MiaA [Planctomycetota bacterium]|nr:tRNA (adenosine(37)-N6)-dimethylallyltransferase MiaA [Planctomycetota bacterium]
MGPPDLAVRLALALRGAGKHAVIINADSAQVYADLAVLSARPTPGEMQGVPHRLFGTWDGAKACSAADWAAAATAEMAAAHAEDAVPILVGGTGLYIRTLLEGIAPVPPIDEKVRSQVRSMGTPDIYAALMQEDAPYAAQLSPSDRQRLARALEVIRSTGKSLKQWQNQRTGGIGDSVTLAPLILLPDRQTLYARCDTRFATMLETGAVEEVARLLARNLDPSLPVMRAIGVDEIAALLNGTLSREQALAKGQQATRNYAKRQYTWLRHQPPADWPRLSPENCDISNTFEILFR